MSTPANGETADPARTLTRWLRDAHALEGQALVQMRRAVDLAGIPSLSEAFRLHLDETEGHERLVDERLQARGGSPSLPEEAVMRAGGLGFVLFAQMQPDTPGKLTAHAFSYEHLELAWYLVLEEAAGVVEDAGTAAVARRIAAEERTMADRLATQFETVAASSPGGPDALVRYLADAHAIEMQSQTLLRGAAERESDDRLGSLYREHLEETRRHVSRLDEVLHGRGAGASAVKDAAMRLGALDWAAFFQVQRDTPVKLAAFAYAFEHLEIAGYELLRRVADRSGASEARDAAAQTLQEERAAAARLEAALPAALRVSW